MSSWPGLPLNTFAGQLESLYGFLGFIGVITLAIIGMLYVGFYIVQRGSVNVHRVNATGKEQIIHIFRTGDSFAEVTLASEKGYPADARALEATQLLLVQKDGIIECSLAAESLRIANKTPLNYSSARSSRPSNRLISGPIRLSCSRWTEASFSKTSSPRRVS